MKKGKKLMALLLAAVAAVSMTACGGDSGKKNENVDYNIMGNYVYQNVVVHILVLFAGVSPACRHRYRCNRR